MKMTITRYSNYLRIVLPGIDPLVTIAAANTLGNQKNHTFILVCVNCISTKRICFCPSGHLARNSADLTAEFVEFECQRSLEWLQSDRVEARRFAAVLVLNQLLVNAPTLVNAFVPQIIQLIWAALIRDPKITIREGAAETLHTCLLLVGQRDSTFKRHWFKKIYEEAKTGFKINSIDSVHGSLLTLKQIMELTGKV